MEMDRLVKIILLVIGFTLAFLWLSKTFSSCTTADTALEADTLLDDDNKEELFEGDEIDYSTSSLDDEPIKEEIVEDLEKMRATHQSVGLPADLVQLFKQDYEISIEG